MKKTYIVPSCMAIDGQSEVILAGSVNNEVGDGVQLGKITEFGLWDLDATEE